MRFFLYASCELVEQPLFAGKLPSGSHDRAVDLPSVFRHDRAQCRVAFRFCVIEALVPYHGPEGHAAWEIRHGYLRLDRRDRSPVRRWRALRHQHQLSLACGFKCRQGAAHQQEKQCGDFSVHFMALLFFIHFHFCLRLPPPFFKREPGTQGCLASAFRKSPLLKKRGFMCFIVRYRLFLSDASRFISGTVCRRTSATISSSALHTRRSGTFFASLKVLARVYKRPANNPAQANIRCLATIFVFMHKCQFIRYLAYNIPEARKCKPEVCKKTPDR